MVKRKKTYVTGFGFLGNIDFSFKTSNFISVKIWWLVISASLDLTCEMIENAMADVGYECSIMILVSFIELPFVKLWTYMRHLLCWMLFLWSFSFFVCLIKNNLEVVWQKIVHVFTCFRYCKEHIGWSTKHSFFIKTHILKWRALCSCKVQTCTDLFQEESWVRKQHVVNKSLQFLLGKLFLCGSSSPPIPTWEMLKSITVSLSFGHLLSVRDYSNNENK